VLKVSSAGDSNCIVRRQQSVDAFTAEHGDESRHFVQQHGDFGDDIGSCSGAAVLACSENKLEVHKAAVSFSGAHYLIDY
jgi:hypothetical protein